MSIRPGTTIVAPDAVGPAGGDHYRVFTPYWRAWRRVPWREVCPAPRALRLPDGLDAGPIPDRLAGGRARLGPVSPDRPAGGETVGRRRVARWVRTGLAGYDERHDDLPGDRTSRLSPYLHFGCVSPLEVLERASAGAGAEAFVRQLCWRDFHHQVLAARPGRRDRDYRPRGDRWRDDPTRCAAWREGRTGYPDRRRRDAPAAGRGVHAQPGPDDRRRRS